MTPAERALAQAYQRYRKSRVDADKLVNVEVAQVRRALNTHAEEVRKAVQEANRSAPVLLVSGVKIQIRYTLRWTSWYRVNGYFMNKAGLTTTFLVAGQSYDTKSRAAAAANLVADSRQASARERQQRRMAQTRLRAATAGLPAPQAAAIQALITQVLRRS